MGSSSPVSIKFKQENQSNTLVYMHPLIVMIMFEMAAWCLIRGIKFVVTDTISTYKKDKKLGRTSDSHRTKRAFDLRQWTFSERELQAFIKHFNDKYAEIASISASDNVSRLVVLHGEGNQLHMHIALHSRFSIKY